MKQVIGVLRGLGVLLAVWGILIGIGFIAGVIPPDGAHAGANGEEVATGESDGETSEGQGSEGQGSEEDGSEGHGSEAQGSEAQGSGDSSEEANEATNDDGTDPDEVASNDGLSDVSAEESTAADEGTERAENAPTGPAVPSYLACDGTVTRPAIAALQLIGDPRPELLVGCGRTFHVLSLDPTSLRPSRVATIEAPAPPEGQRIESGQPSSGDVDADGLPDLVVPFLASDAQGASVGGFVHLLRRSTTGGFETPMRLGTIAAVDTLVTSLDSSAGDEILALNRASALARRPSEAWVFTGSASPTRSASLRTGIGGTAIAVADLNVDGHKDLVAIVDDEPRVDVFFGDGAGGFPTSQSITVTGGAEAISMDVDGDGNLDVLIRAENLQVLRAGSSETLETETVGGPAGLREIALYDINRDGKKDLVGIVGRRIVWIERDDEDSFEEHALAASLRPHVFEVGDFNTDRRVDLAAVSRGEQVGMPWTLTVVPNVREHGGAIRPATPIEDAPLNLRLTVQ
ncbi:MAG: FG-GAP-like repeat-containing protein [Myxococcota bacterium]